MLPIVMAKKGECKPIVKISGRDEVRQHLAELGFVVGEPVEVIAEISGNLILGIKACRIALSREMANRIMV